MAWRKEYVVGSGLLKTIKLRERGDRKKEMEIEQRWRGVWEENIRNRNYNENVREERGESGRHG